MEKGGQKGSDKKTIEVADLTRGERYDCVAPT